MVDLSKFKMPIGSIVIDASMVVALIWSQATTVEQLKTMNDRVNQIESGNIRSNTEPRLLVLERRADEMSEFKGEMRAQLNRIEDKLDRIYAR